MPRKQPARSHVTIREVALEAGVSTATVSRVLSGQEQRVSGERAERVRLVARKLHYQPNSAARSLRAKKSPVGAWIGTDGEFVSAIAAGIDDFLQRHDHALVLTRVRGTARPNQTQHESPGTPSTLPALALPAFELGEATARWLLQRAQSADKQPDDRAMPAPPVVHTPFADEAHASEPSAGSIYHSAVVLPGTKSRSE